jgi:hypothetical protein
MQCTPSWQSGTRTVSWVGDMYRERSRCMPGWGRCFGHAFDGERRLTGRDPFMRRDPFRAARSCRYHEILFVRQGPLRTARSSSCREKSCSEVVFVRWEDLPPVRSSSSSDTICQARDSLTGVGSSYSREILLVQDKTLFPAGCSVMTYFLRSAGGSDRASWLGFQGARSMLLDNAPAI